MHVELWDAEIDAAREKIRAEAREFVQWMPGGDPGFGSIEERARAMRAAESTLVLTSELAHDRVVDGPRGPISIREFRPERPAGVMLHIHGGGWTTGMPAQTDLLNEPLCQHLDLAIVSVDYRLAPEHPFPAGPDDCEDAAMWLVENARSEYGTDRLLIGGESAGANLSAVTLVRLRDRHDAARHFRGANLVFGCYDLSSTPSAHGIGLPPDTVDILDPQTMGLFVEAYTPGWTAEQRRSPDLSPLFADLAGLPPALFMVGTADHLIDDTMFLAQRWSLAGSDAELLVYPDAPHACMALPTVLSHWWPRLETFLARCLKDD